MHGPISIKSVKYCHVYRTEVQKEDFKNN